MTIYNGDESLGVGSLDGAGQATINADTSELHVGSINLRVAYSGDDNFAPVSVTLPVTVDPAVTSAQSSEASDTAGNVADTATSVQSVTLASTGFATATWVIAGVLLLAVGSFILLGLARRPSRRH